MTGWRAMIPIGVDSTINDRLPRFLLPPPSVPPAPPALTPSRSRGLTKIYRGSARSTPGKTALDGIDLDIPRGSIFGLLGPQRRRQIDPHQHPRRAGHQDRGQRPHLGHRHRRRAAPVARRDRRRAAGDRARLLLHAARAARHAGRLLRRAESRAPHRRRFSKPSASPTRPTSLARTLSGGMRRRLMVAKAMVHKPPVLVLDEPTAGVDVELRQQLWAMVRELAGARHHHPADDALSRRGGGAVRPHRHHQPRPARRLRHDGGAARPGRRQDADHHPRPADYGPARATRGARLFAVNAR